MLFSQVTLSDIERVIPLVERPLADIGIVPWDNTAFGDVEADVAAESLGA